MPRDRGANAQRSGSPMGSRGVGYGRKKSLIKVTTGVGVVVSVVVSTD